MECHGQSRGITEIRNRASKIPYHRVTIDQNEDPAKPKLSGVRFPYLFSRSLDRDKPISPQFTLSDSA
jgi:hypothetical protein